MTEKVIGGGTLLAAVVALWITRRSWRSPLDRPAALNILLQSAKLLVVAPVWNFWLSSKLHTFTHVWNLEELISHLCYLCGMMAVVYLLVLRLDMTTAELRAYVQYRIQLPATIAVSCMIGLFVFGPGRAYVVDTVTTETTDWLRAYWLVADVFISYLVVQAFQALRILRRDPRSRKASNLYLAAVSVTAVGVFAFQLEIGWLQWLIIRAEVVAYAVAASYTWHTKIQKSDTADQLQPR